MVKKYGPTYGKTAKRAIASMLATGAAVKVTPAKKSRSAKVSVNVKKYVKKAIDGEIQDKCDVLTILSTAGGSTNGLVRGYGIDSSTANHGITTASVIPGVPQGTDEDKRIGNYVRPKSLVVNYTITALPIDPVTPSNKAEGLPFYCVVVFYSRKDNRTSSVNNTIKDFGSLNVAMTSINDLLLPFNRELYTIHSYKKYKMYACQRVDIIAGQQVLSAINGFPGYTPQVMCSQRLKLPKKLMFDDGATNPTNARIYCGIGVFNITNDTSERANTIRAKVEMNSVLTYQNA